MEGGRKGAQKSGYKNNLQYLYINYSKCDLQGCLAITSGKNKSRRQEIKGRGK